MSFVDDGMWAENLEEFLFEEKKPVTYKWLSRTLKVHVNVAKQMMYEFSQRNKGRVACVYLLAGFTSDKNFLVKLSKEENLKSSESLFDKITSKHVHTISASEGANLILSQINLINLDLDVRKENKPTTAYSGISNKHATPRSEPRSVELQQSEVSEPKAPPNQSSKEKPKTGIEEMISKQKEKGEVSKPAPKQMTAKKGGISGMFAKQAASNLLKKSTETVPKVKSPETSPGKENLSNHLKEEVQQKATKTETKLDSKKRGSSQKVENPSKRRKRIQVASDSDSSEEDDTEKESQFLEDSPPPPQARKIDSDDENFHSPIDDEVKKNERSHKRVRKMVKKTYVGEDGYMVTKMEMGSCSEESEPETNKCSTNPAPASTAPANVDSKKTVSLSNSSSGGKTKQASIKNFFSKK